MARTLRSVAPAASTEVTTRDERGRFQRGHGCSAVELLDVDPDKVAPWLQPALARARKRYSGARHSGLFKETGSRLDGMLRAACVADMHHEALTAHAVTLADVTAYCELMDEARASAREAKTTWRALFALVGGVKRAKGSSDPLAELAAKMKRERQSRGDEADDEGEDDDD